MDNVLKGVTIGIGAILLALSLMIMLYMDRQVSDNQNMDYMKWEKDIGG